MTDTFEPIGEAAARVVAKIVNPAKIQRIPITDRASWLAMRRQDITASVASALLGAHPYATAYSLWAEKTGKLPADGELNAAMERGLELEPLAAKWVARERPAWRIEEPGAYYRDPAARLGATPDRFAYDPERGGGVIQIKSVEPSRFRKDWRNESGETEPPLWIVVQAIVEAHLTGATWAAVAALVISYGIQIHIVEVPLHAGIIERVRAETAAFWRLVEEGGTPDPDWKRDGRLIEQLYDPTGEIVSLEADNTLPGLLDEREALGAARSTAEGRLKEIKAELLTKLGGASVGRIADGRLITAKRIDRKAYEVRASSYLDVRVKQPQEQRA